MTSSLHVFPPINVPDKLLFQARLVRNVNVERLVNQLLCVANFAYCTQHWVYCINKHYCSCVISEHIVAYNASTSTMYKHMSVVYYGNYRNLV